MAPHPAVAEIRRAVRELLIFLRQGSPGLQSAGRSRTGHPASGISSARRSRTARLLVACSGGADSLALAAATAFEAPRLGLAAGLVTVDHGLQEGSADHAARVAAFGYELGLDPVETLTVDVGTAGGPEAAARDARYAALSATAGALDADVLLGHTLDDQAETVLLGLGRGSGPRSIAGMRAVGPGPTGNAPGSEAAAAGTGLFLRPLLGVRRTTTLAACHALGLEPWADPHNADPSFQRVRLRREVLPLLEDVLQGGVAEALARTAGLVRDDLDALDQIAAMNTPFIAPEADERGVHALEVAALLDQPRAIRTRVLRVWAIAVGASELTATHTAALDALVVDWHGQGALDLPGGVRVVRASGKLDAIAPTPSARQGPP
ncbi:MAG: tRNA lysidine(34) synthetase TilS [Jatrophihabitantaceae bacterium]